MGLFSRVGSITPADAHAALRRGELRLVDVREDDEVAQGAAPGAEHIRLGELDSRMAELQGGRVAFVCASGARSAAATRAAAKAGIDASNVKGGMMAWARAGLPVEPHRGTA